MLIIALYNLLNRKRRKGNFSDKLSENTDTYKYIPVLSNYMLRKAHLRLYILYIYEYCIESKTQLKVYSSVESFDEFPKVKSKRPIIHKLGV